ncbi:MAG: rod shape-determining protein MreD [Planctomycetaceae bacterium]
MWHTTLIVAGLYAAFVIQTSVLPLVCVRPWTLHIVLSAIVIVMLRSGARAGIVTAALGGLVSDCLSTGPLGIDLCLFVIVAHLTQMARNDRTGASPLVIGLFAGTAALLSEFIATSLRLALAGEPLPLREIGASATACGLSTAAVMVVAATLWQAMAGTAEAGGHTAVSNRWRMLTR